MEEPHIPESFNRKIGVRRFLTTIIHDHLLFLASGLSFDALLAAIPLALVFLAILGADDLRAVLDVMMPTGAAGTNAPLDNAERILNRVVASRRELSLYGAPLFLLFSTRLFASARVALDQIRAVKTRRRFVHDLAYDLVMVLTTTALFALNSYISVPAFAWSGLERLSAHLLAIAFGTVLFSSVYFLAPTRRIEWRIVLLVAFIVSVVFEISKNFFGVYVVQFATVNRLISHANAIAVLLFVLWIYVMALIFLLGGEIAKAVEERRRTTEMAVVTPGQPQRRKTDAKPPVIDDKPDPTTSQAVSDPP